MIAGDLARLSEEGLRVHATAPAPQMSTPSTTGKKKPGTRPGRGSTPGRKELHADKTLSPMSQPDCLERADSAFEVCAAGRWPPKCQRCRRPCPSSVNKRELEVGSRYTKKRPPWRPGDRRQQGREGGGRRRRCGNCSPGPSPTGVMSSDQGSSITDRLAFYRVLRHSPPTK